MTTADGTMFEALVNNVVVGIKVTVDGQPMSHHHRRLHLGLSVVVPHMLHIIKQVVTGVIVGVPMTAVMRVGAMMNTSAVDHPEATDRIVIHHYNHHLHLQQHHLLYWLPVPINLG